MIQLFASFEFFFAPLREPFVVVSRKGAKERNTEAREELSEI
jgi:hypothetical protein